ncbi:MAG: hypothetical protein V3R73_05010 [Sphingomonadales bacterium]
MNSKGSLRGIIAIVSFVAALFLSADFRPAKGAGAQGDVLVAQAVGGVSKEALLNIPTGDATRELKRNQIKLADVEAYDPAMANEYMAMFNAVPDPLEKGQTVVLVVDEGKVVWLYVEDEEQERRRRKKKRSPQREKVGEGEVLDGQPGDFFGTLTSGKVLAGVGAAALIAIIIEASTGGSKKKSLPPAPGPGAGPGPGTTTTTHPASTSTSTSTSTGTK